MAYKINRWLIDKEVHTHPFSAYWNNPEWEKGKLWGLYEHDFTELEKRFAKKKLLEQFEVILRTGGVNLQDKIGASLASGTCLLEALIIAKYLELRRLYCVEFSKHRIEVMAPPTLAHYQISPERVELCLGSFYDLRIENESLDFVLLSQAFHHANKPARLLGEVKRVLKPQGQVFIIGEHYFSGSEFLRRTARHFAKFVLNWKGYRDKASPLPYWHTIIPNDATKGDHHYMRHEYRVMFEDAGFKWEPFIFRDVRNQGFLLYKS